VVSQLFRQRLVRKSLRIGLRAIWLVVAVEAWRVAANCVSQDNLDAMGARNSKRQPVVLLFFRIFSDFDFAFLNLLQFFANFPFFWPQPTRKFDDMQNPFRPQNAYADILLYTPKAQAERSMKSPQAMPKLSQTTFNLLPNTSFHPTATSATAT
jgi:hypothetical protein